LHEEIGFDERWEYDEELEKTDQFGAGGLYAAGIDVGFGICFATPRRGT